MKGLFHFLQTHTEFYHTSAQILTKLESPKVVKKTPKTQNNANAPPVHEPAEQTNNQYNKLLDSWCFFSLISSAFMLFIMRQYKLAETQKIPGSLEAADMTGKYGDRGFTR